MSIAGIFKNTEIKLVKKGGINGEKYTFHFKPESVLNRKAGQDGIFKFKGPKLKGRNFRILTVASSAKEEEIIIGTNISDNPSEFKQKLKSMEIGDSIYLRGPFGFFTVSDYNKKVALIAGGIGITPMRAILKNLETKNLEKEVTLFYIDSEKDFAFKEDLVDISNNNPMIKILFIDNRKTFDESLSKYVETNLNESLYYISGSPKMVKSIRENIKNKGISNKNISNHKLLGYK